MKLKQQHFSHDINASRDEKILALRESWGIAGYGLYWLVIEYLFTTGGQARRDSGKLIAKAISEDPRKVQRFLEEAIDVYHLFDTDRTYFWSNRLRSELEAIMSKTEKARESVMHRYNKKDDKSNDHRDLDNANDEESNYERSTDVVRTNNERSTIREDNIKEYKENKISFQSKFKKPTVDEVKDYCTERDNIVDPQHFIDYYESIGWKVGKNPMKDWKATVRRWEKNSDSNKQNCSGKTAITQDDIVPARSIFDDLRDEQEASK